MQFLGTPIKRLSFSITTLGYNTDRQSFPCITTQRYNPEMKSNLSPSTAMLHHNRDMVTQSSPSITSQNYKDTQSSQDDVKTAIKFFDFLIV